MRGKLGRIAVVAIVVIGGTACFWRLALARVGQQPSRYGPQIGQEFIPPDGPTAFLVSINGTANLDPNTKQLHQSMATALNGYAVVPNNRLTYWSAVNNANAFVVMGWQGMITDVQANGNGNLVTVMVSPSLASDTYGQACVILNSDYSEQYQVNNDGTFVYVGSFDPQGLAGQLPGIASL